MKHLQAFYEHGTVDGKHVMLGPFAWELGATYGLPLDVIVSKGAEHNYVVDWVSYIRTGISSGANTQSLLTKVRGAILEAFGPNYSFHFNGRLADATTKWLHVKQ